MNDSEHASTSPERTSKTRTRREVQAALLRDVILCGAAWCGGVAFQASWWVLWAVALVATVGFLVLTNPTLARWRAIRG